MEISSWTYHNSVSVKYGLDLLDQLGEYLSGDAIALITSPGFRKRGLIDRIEAVFGERLVAVVDDVAPNPDIETLDRQLERLRPLNPDGFIALGGGSSIDSAKALARLLGQREPLTFAQNLRGGAALADLARIPIVAIPTTAGTGAEVTPFATVWDVRNRAKHSIVGPDILPRQALLDPQLTVSLPVETTVSSGLDTISHALESIWNVHSHPVSVSFAISALQLAFDGLPKVFAEPGNLAARGAMLQASGLAGLAISQTRTALAHSISYPLTAHYGLPHGFACSFSLPQLLLFNADADDGRLQTLAQTLGYPDVERLSASLQALLVEVGVPGFLRRYLPDSQEVALLADQMIHPDRAGNNLRGASVAEVRTLVESSMTALYEEPSQGRD